MAREVGLQQEGFEEPVGVGQMPFGWTGILHALESQILGLQWIDQRLTAPSHLQQGVQQQGAVDAPRTLVGSVNELTTGTITTKHSVLRERVQRHGSRHRAERSLQAGVWAL